ncbi:MAG: glycosyltransferase family 4 protein [Burkholderiales bacterium]
MRVALFVHCFYPSHIYGTETYTLELARNLRALGHEPVVVSAVFAGEPAQPATVHRYEHEGIPVLSIDKNAYPHTRVKDTYYQPSMRGVLGELLDEVRPDLVHVTHLINHTGVLLEATAARGLPTIATFTDFFGFCYNNKLEAHDGSLCAGPASPAVNCLACHVKAVADGSGSQDWRTRFKRTPTGAGLAARGMHLAQTLPPLRAGTLAGKVQDIEQRPHILATLYRNYARAIVPTAFIEGAYARNGFARPMDRIAFGVDIDRAPKRRERGGPPLVLGFIGQIMRHKGPDLLVDAARAAFDPGDYEIKIYGSMTQDPAYAAALQQRAAGLPVQFMGTFAPERMRDVLDGMDVLAIPSRWYENSPLVLLNALASHTPVIVSDVEGMTEFVKEGVNGYTFARGSVAALTQVLARLRRDPAGLRALAETTSYAMTTREMTRRTVETYGKVRAAAGAAAD